MLETCSIVINSAGADRTQEIWQHLDEQFLGSEQRLNLLQNGLRCGTVGSKLPDCILQELSNDTRKANSDPDAISVEARSERQGQRLRISEGRETILVTGDTRPEVVILVAEEGKVTGQVYHEAQTVVSLTTRSVGDCDVELTLTPEVHHGPNRQKIVGGDGTLRMESSRERDIFSELTIRVRLTPGQSVVLSSIGPEASLGGRFFGGDDRRKLLFIRLASSNHDRLFSIWGMDKSAAETEAATLETPQTAEAL